LAGRDTLATMPTGAGKSLTFQLPAIVRDDVTLVLSPLIALMKDQVDSLPPAVRAQTILVNSTLTPGEVRDALRGIEAHQYRLVYAAPERLRQAAFVQALRNAGTGLVVIDEAHCISMWGHDFRPDYLTIPGTLHQLGDPAVLAITATATDRTAASIAEALGRELTRVRVSLFRPNLFYEVHRLTNREQKITKTIELCRAIRGQGIVYVSSRKDAEAVASLLSARANGISAVPYHAGLPPNVRARNQDAFMSGGARVIVATVAFGMGVNKADVRFIIHLSPPNSLEAYAQESGRAGRDGKPARCALLVTPADWTNLTRLIRRDETSIETLRRIYAGLQRAARGRWAIVNPDQLIGATVERDEEPPDPRIALGILERAGLIRRHPDTPINRTLYRIHAGDSSDAGPSWERFVGWWREVTAADPEGNFSTAAACSALNLTPVELDELIQKAGVGVSEGPRATCLEMLPAGPNAAETLNQVLAQTRADAIARIERMRDYCEGARCRHVTLAAHLGESLNACGAVCDVCTGKASARADHPAAATARPLVTSADVRAVLEGVRTLPFPMGKPGLTKLLLGSIESKVRGDRSPVFGALAELTRNRVGTLIDALVSAGLLSRDLDHEYKIIQLTERGAHASDTDLEPFASVTPQRQSGSTSRQPQIAATDELDPSGVELLQALTTWRSQRASADRVPPYVVAHNSMLHSLALLQPRDTTALANVPGYGPARIAKYGDELFALIAKHSKATCPK
nr:ATP-dependent DNA helicase RecQ [Chloroflexia bacterium]